ncbi:mechanosensitive ion channel family protein [Sulfitobacter donghicola]|uniref:Small mechanosensitive ion channel protein MscS n=1 Tax=Sulfitobacter donghicola DSW-25 = KCTC 12864 = JCM 14565 TaxID=1300350 RepID=A0A073IJD6_9RHOB|nr:mechanosensitive ion channel family protein [Sulfitobacter donghicola]KEJ89695.1 small mechanosensitive ion channel protein MscS [Sulfitobacter donghicola DSW-25 = KCTC 12864 = JCM 14565]
MLLLAFTWLLFTFLPAADVSAQSLTSMLGGSEEVEETVAETTPQETLAETLRNAARDGVDVIVIDTQGQVITQSAPEEDDADAIEPTAEDYSRLMKVQEGADRARDALIDRVAQLPNAFREVAYILRAASPDGTILMYFKILGWSLLLFGVGVIVEREIFAKRFARKFVVSRVMDSPAGYAEKMPFLVFRFLMGVIGILCSMAVAYVLGAVLFPPIDDSAIQFTLTLINIGYFSCRVMAGLWRMILSPYLSQYRIPIISDSDAKRLHNWLWILGSLDLCAILFGIWIGELGLNYDVYALVSSVMSGGVVLLNILLVVVNRRAISAALRHGKEPNEVGILVRLLSKLWAPAVVIYVVFAWFELTYDLVLERPSSIPLIAGAYGILISIIVVYGVVNYLIERGFARARVLRLLREKQAELEAQELARLEKEAFEQRLRRDEGLDLDRESALEGDNPAGALAERIEPAEAVSPAGASLTQAEHDMLSAAAEERGKPVRVLNSFEALARRVAGILAFVAGSYAFFYIWDNDSAQMVESSLYRVMDIIVIIFIGYIVYHAFRIWIDTKIAEEAQDEVEAEPGDEGGASSASRLATLLPLFRNFTLIVVIVTIILIVLMEVGINVGPLFAGAGIVGVAVGFGSQALVRDIFAGAFFLFDDAFRKGEYLDVGGVKGTVEKISVRSFQLRHHLGALHTIPFGELQVMTNYSRDWVIMKLPLRVTYDTDVEKVRKLIKKLGISLLDDPVIGQNFIAPLKSQGVIEMQDSAMIIRVKFMTKPGDQWLVRKRVYEEIRVLFEREGIKFAHREVTVRLADGKVDDLTEEQKRRVAAAAHASIEEQLEEAAEANDGDDR